MGRGSSAYTSSPTPAMRPWSRASTRADSETMGPLAILINTARGPIVSESALVEALDQGRIAGVGLDVYAEEPLPMNHPLRRLDNVVLLPHRGYATVEILRERYEMAMTNILSFLDGKPVNLLNPEVLNRAGS